MLDELVTRIENAVNTFTDDYEIILVNDCSPDDSWNKIKNTCKKDTKVRGINLSRNFGQHNAIQAGISQGKGEWTIVMDCDLQDRPEEIPRLYHKAQEGYDTVFAEIIVRNDTFMKRLTSRAFNHLLAYLTDTPVRRKTNNFGIYHRSVIDAVVSMGDYIKYFPMAVRWVGFRIGYVPVHKDARAEGTSGYTWSKLIKFALNNIMAYSNKPLKIAMQFGFTIVLISILIALFYLLRYISGGIAVSGFTTIVLSMWILGGIIISLIGIVGIYLGRVFDQTKKRPPFVIAETAGYSE